MDDDTKGANKVGIFDFRDDDIDDELQTNVKKQSSKSQDTAEGPVTGDVGTLQASFNMMKVFVGIGILATPASFGQVGLIAGCMGMILIGVIAMYTMQL